MIAVRFVYTASTLVLTLLAVVTPGLMSTVLAQNRNPPALDLSAGQVGFADDGVVSERMVGAAGRIYLSPRVAIGPELVHISGDRHRHLVLTGNFTVDLMAQPPGRPARVTPFLVAGGGMFQTCESFAGGTFTHTEGAFTAGAGLRAAVSDSITVGVDARVGWEPHVRINGVVGVRLGR